MFCSVVWNRPSGSSKRVAEAALNRAPVKQPVPRYQIQRMFRFFLNASRTDLLVPLINHAARTYPSPPAASARRPAGKGVAYGGSLPTMSDDELFTVLVSAGEIPKGCDALLWEAVEEGFEVVEGDQSGSLNALDFHQSDRMLVC